MQYKVSYQGEYPAQIPKAPPDKFEGTLIGVEKGLEAEDIWANFLSKKLYVFKSIFENLTTTLSPKR